jgi:hypothetical protein
VPSVESAPSHHACVIPPRSFELEQRHHAATAIMPNALPGEVVPRRPFCAVADGLCRASPSVPPPMEHVGRVLPCHCWPNLVPRVGPARPCQSPCPTPCYARYVPSPAMAAMAFFYVVSDSEGPLKVAVELEPTTVAC